MPYPKLKLQKPKPPKDLWERMDAALEEIRWKPNIPANALTCAAFMEKRGLTKHQANRRLKALQVAGKITKHCAGGSNYYYLMVD